VRVSVFYNPTKDQAELRARELADELTRIGVDVNKTEKDVFKWKATIDSSIDLVVVFGGDGTFLATARQVVGHGVPIMGVNHGHLGFLSEYGDIELSILAREIKERNWRIEERTVIKAQLPGYGKTFIAINDIAIIRSHYSNLLYTDLYIDDNLLHSFRADGIVVCTPTGSTAYALSAGGAVMDPNIRAFEIVPVAAHSLASRPHVVSDEQRIVLKSKDTIEFFMQADGQELISLDPGASIEVTRFEQPLKLCRLKSADRNFYSILRDKMKWGLTN
jgi:NAD+ kinase